jgi:aconitate hydratase
MAYLQFESMKVPRVRNELAVSYVDHNTLQMGFENADDHAYMESIARKYGMYMSRAGNGICHQVHLESFGKPGVTLLGGDSHTSTAGGIGMIAIGAGGLDIALAMAGKPFYLTCPKVVRINLTGKLSPWVSAKDVVLKVLELFGPRGNVGTAFEYGGEALSTLLVPERATITNMGAECGVTTSIFPSDEITRQFLKSQGREHDWTELVADDDATYEKVIEINLSALVPLTAKPHSPGNVATVQEVGEIQIDQICIGSCTNSSFKDLATVAMILKGRKAHPSVSFVLALGSRQVMLNLEKYGYLRYLLKAGARLTESACGFCVGNGQSPRSGAVSLRTSNRNFKGRSGTQDAKVYLVSPETAAASLIMGKLTDPRTLGIEYPRVPMPEKFERDDTLMIRPEDTDDPDLIQIYRGPNINTPPENDPMPSDIVGEVTIKVGDDVTTDHILPAGEKLKYRPNIPKYSEYVLEPLDNTFHDRAKVIQSSGKHNIIIAGVSYGQGSSREHAAMCPMYLGVKAIIAKSFERIHIANLINFGILPLEFKNQSDYDGIDQGDRLSIPDVRRIIQEGGKITVKNVTKNSEFEVLYDFTKRQIGILIAGGACNV